MLDRSNLYTYQQRAVEFIKTHDACALWVDMGLGKSISTLTAYADLLASFDARRALIVAPLRVARRVWTDEIANWQHVSHLTTSRILGTVKQRWAAIKVPADIHLINRENMRWLESQFINGKKQVRKFPWDLVVLDESQSFKNQSSHRWKAVRKLRRLAPRMVQLTGTPSPNGYGDLWGQFYLLDQGQRLGATETAFRDRWFTPDQNQAGFTTWHLKEGADVQIQAAVADIVLSMREEDYLDLPPVKMNYVRVELPELARKAYRRLARQYITEFGGKTINAVNAGACVGKLIQLANGAVYHDDKGNWTQVHDAKVEALLELLEGVSGPAIIVYGFRHDKARLSAALAKTGKRWALLDSEQSVTDWNAGKTDYLLLHPASAGHGLNLQQSGSEALIWFGLTNNREWYDQANARLIGGHRRAGRNVVVHHIVADDTVDDDLIGLLASKGQLEYGLKTALARLASSL